MMTRKWGAQVLKGGQSPTDQDGWDAVACSICFSAKISNIDSCGSVSIYIYVFFLSSVVSIVLLQVRNMAV